jgi:hypothetical protein
MSTHREKRDHFYQLVYKLLIKNLLLKTKASLLIREIVISESKPQSQEENDFK